jgi:aconitate hydratase
VLAKSYARIHRQNLINFGVLPLTFFVEADYDAVQAGDLLELSGVRLALERGEALTLRNASRDVLVPARHELSERQVEILLAGGLIRWMRDRLGRA